MSGPNIGTRLRELRTKVRLSQEIVARAIEVPRSAITGIESGEREVSARELLTLCRIYRISPNEILGWGDAPEDTQ